MEMELRNRLLELYDLIYVNDNTSDEMLFSWIYVSEEQPERINVYVTKVQDEIYVSDVRRNKVNDDIYCRCDYFNLHEYADPICTMSDVIKWVLKELNLDTDMFIMKYDKTNSECFKFFDCHFRRIYLDAEECDAVIFLDEPINVHKVTDAVVIKGYNTLPDFKIADIVMNHFFRE